MSDSIRPSPKGKHAHNYKDIAGVAFHSLTAKKFHHRDKKYGSIWECECVCGRIILVRKCSLVTGNTKSCGCMQGHYKSLAKTLHGNCRGKGRTSPEFISWIAIKGRCLNANLPEYANYGARGITVCAGLRSSFSAFLFTLGARPTRRHSIERIDNKGSYSCGECNECAEHGWAMNCRWATKGEQANNTRASRRLTLNGRTQTLAQWSKELDINPGTLWDRLNNGWSVERALKTPARRAKPWPQEVKIKAKSAVYIAVQAGRLPKIKNVKCCKCGEPAKAYHHHLGYDRQHWLDVIPVCFQCHGKCETISYSPS